jgi:hypothetical protein
MGRVARYKRIKACDPYSKQNQAARRDSKTLGNVDRSTLVVPVSTAAVVWGLSGDGRKAKKRSLTAQKLQQAKLQRRIAKFKGKASVPDPGSLRSFDVAYNGDDFNLDDLEGSLKREAPLSVENSSTENKSQVGSTSVPLSASDFSTSTPSSVVAALTRLDDEDSTGSGRDQQSITSKQPAATEADFDKESKRTAHWVLKKIEDQVISRSEKAAKSAPPAGRQEGESKRAYERRSKSETRQIMAKGVAAGHNPAKKERKKEYLKQKKLKKKLGKGASSSSNVDGDDFYGGRMASGSFPAPDLPVFGEQVERPPVFRQLPRGASSNPKLQPGKQQKISKTMSQTEIQDEQKAMEQMRRKVQAQYALVRSQRRQAGHFDQT